MRLVWRYNNGMINDFTDWSLDMSEKKEKVATAEEKNYVSGKDLAEKTVEDIRKYIEQQKEKESKYPRVDWRSIFDRLFPKDQFFFDYILGKMRVIKSVQVPIAGVTFSPKLNRFILLYNDVNMREIYHTLGVEKIRGIIKHEIFHVLLGHVTERRPKNPKLAKIWNYATDLAINTNIPQNELPEFTLLPGREPFEDFEPARNSEFYFLKIIEKFEDMTEEEMQSMGIGDGSLGDAISNHELWEYMNGEAKGAADDVKEALMEAAKAAGRELVESGMVQDAESRERSGYNRSRMPGNMPYNTYKEIMEGYKIVKFGIKDLINALSTKAIMDRSRKCSRKIVNKRFKKFSGVRRRAHVPHVVIAIDQSGSVDDNMVHMFFEVSKRLNKYFKITILPFDTRVNVDTICTFEKGQFKGDHQRTCCGGTEFDAVIEYTNKNYRQCDLIIVTDLGDSFPETPSKHPVYWVAGHHDIEHSYDGKFLDHTSVKLFEVSMEGQEA
jgi:predicted metal-dependent peptidase